MLDAFEADLPPRPEASPEWIDRVSTALGSTRATERVPPDPQLTPEARRAYQKQAAVVGAVALAAVAFGALRVPMLAVALAPVVALCAAVIAIHAVALRRARLR